MRQDAILAAETHHVPDDQEVARQVQLFDYPQLVFDLAAGALMIGTITFASPLVGDLAQVGHHRLARRNRIVGELVAEILQRELKPCSEILCVAYCLGEVAKKSGHLGRTFEMPLGIGIKQPAGLVKHCLLANASKRIEQSTAGLFGVADAVGRKQR